MTRKFAIGAFLISLVIAGCAAPAAQGTQAASNTATASAGGTPSVSPTTLSATSVPIGTPAPSLGFEAPDGILPPWSTAVVVVDALQVRAEPGFNGPVHATASAGEVFLVIGGPEVVDGLDWYRLFLIPDALTWAAAGSGADRYLELVPPNCPEADPDLAAVVLMTPWEQLACFGERPLTFEGTYGCAGCGGTAEPAGEFEPAWLAYPMNFDWLFPDYASGSGYLELRFAPDSGLERPSQGAIVRVTGHFNDARSATCRMVTFEGEQATQIDSRAAEWACRERFVVDGFDVIGTDPDFP
jgi:hypothetical protein